MSYRVFLPLEEWTPQRKCDFHSRPDQRSTVADLDPFSNLRSNKSSVCPRLVEAGGVEPPSEKRCATEPTCLSQFRLVRQSRLERARNAAG